MIDIRQRVSKSPSAARVSVEAMETPINIMGDPRVYRGVAYGKIALSIVPGADLPRKMAKKLLHPGNRLNSRPISIAKLHQEEQSNEGCGRIRHSIAQVQTDLFRNRPSTPPYIPTKIGMDNSTQLDPESGDLFDFNGAISGTVSVLVGKTLEQALMEVRMEADLVAIAQRKRIAMLASSSREQATADLECSEAARIFDTGQKVICERQRVKAEQNVTQKSISYRLAPEYLSNLTASVFKSLERRGFLYDRQKSAVEECVLPYLVDTITERIDLNAIASDIVHDIIHFTAKRVSDQFHETAKAADRRYLELEQWRRIREMPVKLHLRVKNEQKLVGPVTVRNEQTIGDVQIAIRKWMAANAPDLADENDGRAISINLEQRQLGKEEIIMEIPINNQSTLDLTFIDP